MEGFGVAGGERGRRGYEEEGVVVWRRWMAEREEGRGRRKEEGVILRSPQLIVGKETPHTESLPTLITIPPLIGSTKHYTSQEITATHTREGNTDPSG